MSGRPLLEIEGLAKTYKGGWGLHGVSFAVPAGVMVAVGGPNGSGKSTLLRCVAGLQRHGGAVRIDGMSSSDRATRSVVGYLPQVPSLPVQATVGEMLALFAALCGVEPGSHPLPEGFVAPSDQQIATLSGGQRHRVSLAVALLGSPRLLLLDEPVANLDEEARATFWGVLDRMRRDGVTALISSPAPSELLGVVDRAVTLRDGRIVEDVELPSLGDEREAGCREVPA